MSFRRSVRKALYRIGLERVRTPSFVELISAEGIQTVLDVGANEGQYASDLRAFGYSGRIVSFEPSASAFALLARAAAGDRNWDVRKVALGSKDGEEKLLISENSVFNSFKRPSDYTLGQFPDSSIRGSENVAVRRLDGILEAEPRLCENAYLKIDAQGFEYEIMIGAGDRLCQFNAIQLELPLRAIYDDQPLFLDVAQWMERKGFVIAMAKENGFDRGAVRLLELDTVFVRSDRYGGVRNTFKTDLM